MLASGASKELEPILGLAMAMLFGLVLTRLMKLMKMPNVTGYLIAGILVGPHLLNFIGAAGGNEGFFNLFGMNGSATVFGTEPFSNGDLITTVALGFIAFSIGSSFELKHMKTLGKSVAVITIFQALVTVLLVDAALIAVSLIAPDVCPMPVAIILGAIATATAPAATLLVVKQYKAKGPVTDTLLPVVAMDDAVGLMVFAVSFSIAKVMLEGGTITFASAFLEPVLEIAESLALGAALGFIVAFSMKIFMSRANRIGVEIAAVFAGVALADMWGLSNLLVCMMIGAVYCNLHKDDVKLNNFAERWTAPLFMLFFIVSGAELNLSVIPKVGVIGIIYLVVRCLGKYFGAYLGAKTVKAEKHVKNYLGLTLFPQAGVAIGMATMVVAELSSTGDPAITSLGTQINTVVLCATLIYELFGPLITKWALTRSGEIHPDTKAETVYDTRFVLPVEEVADKTLKSENAKDAETADALRTPTENTDKNP
ncbi:MAG: cation:proton antiporter [Clostridia bacterium]|nr:cation:proton antiporter [Clostridia bacterium]